MSPAWKSHGGRHRLRRLGRLVRPPDESDRQRLPGPSADALTATGMCGARHAVGRLPGPLRLRPPPAAAGHLALQQGQHGGPARSPTSPRSCVSSRTTGWAANASATDRSMPSPAPLEQHVRLLPPRRRQAAPRPDDGRAQELAPGQAPTARVPFPNRTGAPYVPLLLGNLRLHSQSAHTVVRGKGGTFLIASLAVPLHVERATPGWPSQWAVRCAQSLTETVLRT